jgi:hypothetical protein
MAARSECARSESVRRLSRLTPGARIFNGRAIRDVSGQRPCLTWAVTVRGSLSGDQRVLGNRPESSVGCSLTRRHG